MSRNNTGNPIGSKAFPDFEDNVKNLDEAVNTADPQWVDRFGRFRIPLMEQERQFVASQDSRDAQFQSAQSSREAVFSDFLQASGYQDLGEYAPGIEITAHNQYVTFGGQPYLLNPSIPVPYTTSGEWTGEDFKLIGDDSLRQDLANPAKGAAMVARGVVAVDSIADLLALPEGQRKEGLRYLVKGYHAGSDVGGGEFYWSGSRNKADHDGGVFIDPDKVFPADWSSKGDWFDGTSVGAGVFVRAGYEAGIIDITWFGAVSDAESTDAIQAAIRFSDAGGALVGATVYVPLGVFYISAPLYTSAKSNFVLRGAGKARSSTIKVSSDVSEDAPLSAMLVTGDEGGNLVDIRHLTLSGNNRTTRIIDNTNGGERIYATYNATFDSLRIDGIRGDGVGIDGLSWDCQVTNCDIMGYGGTPGEGRWEGTGIQTYGETNGVYFHNNNIRRLTHGIVGTAAHQISITDNVFDNIQKSAIKYVGRILSINITGNYFEKSGMEGFFDDIAAFSAMESVSATIILASRDGDPGFASAWSLDISQNLFFIAETSSVIALSGVCRAGIRENHVLQSTSSSQPRQHDQFVEIFGRGVVRNPSGGTVTVEDNVLYTYNSSSGSLRSCKKVVELSGAAGGEYRHLFSSGIIIKNNVLDYSAKPVGAGSLLDRHPISLISNYTLNTYKIDSSGRFRVDNGGGGAPAYLVQKSGSEVAKLRGTHIRIEVEGATSSGERPRFSVDDGITTDSVNLFSNDASTVFFVSPDATKLEVTYLAYGSGNYTEFDYVDVVTASTPMHARLAPDTITRSSPPTAGEWQRGDEVLNSNPSAGGFMRWVCVSSGSPGVWKGSGSIEA